MAFIKPFLRVLKGIGLAAGGVGLAIFLVLSGLKVAHTEAEWLTFGIMASLAMLLAAAAIVEGLALLHAEVEATVSRVLQGSTAHSRRQPLAEDGGLIPAAHSETASSSR